jgi:hypothetical protein
MVSFEERPACVRAVRYVNAAIVSNSDESSTTGISPANAMHLTISDD